MPQEYTIIQLSLNYSVITNYFLRVISKTFSFFKEFSNYSLRTMLHSKIVILKNRRKVKYKYGSYLYSERPKNPILAK